MRASGESGVTSAWYSAVWLWLLLAFANALPILLSPLPMMPDFFNHVGRYHVMLHQDDALLRSYYDFHPALSANSGIDLVMLVLGRLMPVEQAARLSVGLIAIAMTLGIYALARAVHRQPPAAALLAVPFVWSFPFLFGFLNFCFGLALALLGAALWVRTRDLPTVPRLAVDVALAFAIWLAHLVAFGIFLIICGCFALARLWPLDRSRPWRRTIVDLAAIAWPLLLGLIPSEASVPLFSGAWEPKVKAGLVLQLFRSISKTVDRATLLVLIGFAAALLLLAWKGRARFSRPLLGASLVLAVLWAVLPEAMMGSFYSDLRLLPAVCILFFIAADILPGRLATMAAIVALVLTLGRLALVTVDWQQRSRAAERDLAALRLVPEGARIVVFAPDSGCSDWRLSGNDTLAGLAIGRRRAFVNTEWDTPGASWMRPLYNRERGYNDSLSVQVANPNYARCAAPPVADRLGKLPRDRFDFVWLFGVTVPDGAFPWLAKRYAGPSGTLYAIRRSPLQ